MTRRARRTGRRRFVFAVLPVAALLIAAEAGVRLALDTPALVAAGPLGWTMQPDLVDHLVDQVEPQLDFRVSTNADGLRSSLGRAKAQRRVALVGESTVFGWGVAPAEAPAAVLARALGGGWEVLNAGQPGYSSEQAARLVETLVPAYAPDVVVWFHPWNDLAPARATDRDLLPEHVLPWWRGSRLLTWLADPPRGEALQDSPLMPLRYDGPGDTRRVTAAQRAENLARAARAAGNDRLLAVLLPNDATARTGGQSPLASELGAACAELDLPWLDLTHALGADELATLTLPGDPGHYNQAGNERLMAPVAQALRAGFAKSL